MPPLLRVLTWYGTSQSVLWLCLCVTVRLAVQPSAKLKSTLRANYRYNTWLWVGSKQEGRREITPCSLLVSTLYAVTCDIREKREKITWKQVVNCSLGEQVDPSDDKKAELRRETLLIINVSPRVDCLHQILNVSLCNLWESLSAECRHFSSHLVGFSWLSRESAMTIDRHAEIKLWYKVMYARVSFSPFFFPGPWSAQCHFPGACS